MGPTIINIRNFMGVDIIMEGIFIKEGMVTVKEHTIKVVV